MPVLLSNWDVVKEAFYANSSAMLIGNGLIINTLPLTQNDRDTCIFKFCFGFDLQYANISQSIQSFSSKAKSFDIMDISPSS